MFCLTAVVTLPSIPVQQLKSKSYAKFTKDSSDAFFPLVHVKKHQDKEGGYKCKNICFKNPFVNYPCKNKCEPSIYCIVDGSAIFFNLWGGREGEIEELEYGSKIILKFISNTTVH